MCTLERAGATGRLRGVLSRGSRVGIIASVLALGGCVPKGLRLNAPNIAEAAARDPTPVEVEPITSGGGIAGIYYEPGPAAVLTAAISGELRGRALHGGEPGGYAVRCSLDRFATRTHTSVTDGQETLTAYADLSCEAKRVEDGAVVWRGELRGRTSASEPNVLGSDA